MPGTSAMFKTFVIGVAGLYLVKTIADTEPPKTYANQIHERNGGGIANGQVQMPAIYDGDKSLQKLKESIQQLGAGASQQAQSLYDDAQKSVLQAKKELESKKNDRSGWSKFWASKNPEETQLQQKYDEAKKKLDDLKSNFSKYIKDQQDNSAIGEFGDKVKDAYGKVQDYASNKYYELKSGSEEALRENAQFYKSETEKAKKEWEETQSSWLHWRKAQSKEIQDKAQAKYNYFKAKNDETVNQLVDYLSKAGKQTKDIVNEFGQQAQDQLSAAGEYAQDAGNLAASYAQDFGNAAAEKGNAAKDKLNQQALNAKNYAADAKDRMAGVGYDAKEAVEENAKYAKNQAVKAGQNVKDTVDENAAYVANVAGDVKNRAAKAGSDTAGKIQDDAEYVKSYLAEQKDHLLNAGYNAKEALKDNAEFVKNKAEDNAEYVKDSVYEAGKNAKDNVKENADYVKHYAAGTKDKLHQYGYDAKENIKENAEYAKHYAAGVKDRAAQAGYNAKDKIEDNAEYAKDQADGYVKGAKNWIGKAGESTKNMVVDAYNGMWNHLGVFQTKSKEVAEEAVRYYDEQVADARKKYEETQSSWLHWRSAQPDDVQLQAKAKYELVKAKRDAAEMELKRWTEKSSH